MFQVRDLITNNKGSSSFEDISQLEVDTVGARRYKR